LSGTQFPTLNNAGINDPEGPEKYNNTEVKYGATFNSCHTALDTCCCEVSIKIWKQSDPPEALITTKHYIKRIL
jgi:hypothetical protein